VRSIARARPAASSIRASKSRTTNAVEATISRLRRKIGHHIIETRRSAGYLIRR
jgi:DNA-binding response OmpR family regulator